MSNLVNSSSDGKLGRPGAGEKPSRVQRPDIGEKPDYLYLIIEWHCGYGCSTTAPFTKPGYQLPLDLSHSVIESHQAAQLDLIEHIEQHNDIK